VLHNSILKRAITEAASLFSWNTSLLKCCSN